MFVKIKKMDFATYILHLNNIKIKPSVKKFKTQKIILVIKIFQLFKVILTIQLSFIKFI